MTKAVYHSLRHPPHTQSRISREQASKRKSGKFFEGFDVSPEGSSAKVTYCANSRWEMVSKQGRWGHFWLSEGSACRKPRKNLAQGLLDFEVAHDKRYDAERGSESVLSFCWVAFECARAKASRPLCEGASCGTLKTLHSAIGKRRCGGSGGIKLAEYADPRAVSRGVGIAANAASIVDRRVRRSDDVCGGHRIRVAVGLGHCRLLQR